MVTRRTETGGSFFGAGAQAATARERRSRAAGFTGLCYMGVFEHRRQPVLPVARFRVRLAKSGALALGLVAVSLAIGVVGYRTTENMPWIDAFLNASMLMGGMGPVGELKKDAAKLFASLFALYAGLIFIVAAGVILAPLVHRMLHKLHADPPGR